MNDKSSTGFVYVIHAVGTNRVKIGYITEPERRLLHLQTVSPFPLSLIGKREGPITLERAINRRLQECRQVGEWFEIDTGKCWEIVLAERVIIPAPESPHLADRCRKCFEPVTELVHVPFVLYEILYLAERGQSAEIVPLIKSVIEVTQRQADSLLNLPCVASGEVAE